MRSSAGHILRVGVTGGIGSGKSLVCSLFSQLGIPVLSADDIAKEVMSYDRSLRRELTSLLGASTYRSDRELDRDYIAAKIFFNESLKRKVNGLVHPRVKAELEKRFAELEQRGEKIGIVEAALIYEAGYDKSLNAVIVVDAPEPERVERVVERDKTSAEEVRNRMRAQWPVEQKLRKADYIIRNNGSLRELETSVQFLVKVLQNTVDLV